MRRSVSKAKFTGRSVVRVLYILLLMAAFITGINPPGVNASSPRIDVLRIEGTIVPVVADYVDRGIKQAVQDNSDICIIELDTPGGLLSATEDIIKSIMNSSIPVVVYVTPRGAWAASAGTFITISAHVAAMAPSTTIGAAHPVSVGEQMSEDMAKKATEYSAAYIRSIAETRGRNSAQAELAVTESKSFTSTQAIENKLVDFEANDLDSLIKQLNGRTVKMADGRQVTINTENAILYMNGMNWVEDFLHTISDPNIAYILLGLATIGIFTEITNPGMIFPGIIGGICLLLGFYSLGNLNAHWAGLLLILLALILFIAELFVSAFGILTAGGIVALLIGSFMLFTENTQVLQINPVLIVFVVLIIALFFIFVVGAAVQGQRRRSVTGEDAMVGRVAVAQTDLNPKGTVLLEGERWAATIESDNAVPGEEVIISKVEGLKLMVKKKDK